MKIGIIGAGFIGRAVARLAVKHGHEVMLSNSRHPKTLASTMIAIGCQIGTPAMAASFGDVVLIAIPFSSYLDLDPKPLSGKIVLDANNYYPQRDGNFEALDNHTTTTSELLASHLVGAKVVKACNAILEKDIEKDAKPSGSPERRALPIAGDDAEAKQVVSKLLDNLGYDVVDAGPLGEGWRFERARPAYCVPLDSAKLRQALAEANANMPEGFWRK